MIKGYIGAYLRLVIGLGCAATVLASCAAAPAPAAQQMRPVVTAGAERPVAATPLATFTQFPEGLTWDWQLASPRDLSRDVDVLALDFEDTTAGEIAGLKARGVRTICYVSIGSWEEWRDDADAFPPEVLGKPLPEWPGERYIDMRNLDVLVPIMAARFAKCAEKGFDAIEPDNMGAYDNDTGFGMDGEVLIAYMRGLIAEAHDLGLAMGQKNAIEMVPALAGVMDFMISEQCFQYRECEALGHYIALGKAVFNAEYIESGTDFDAACARSRALGIATILKTRDLNKNGQACPG